MSRRALDDPEGYRFRRFAIAIVCDIGEYPDLEWTTFEMTSRSGTGSQRPQEEEQVSTIMYLRTSTLLVETPSSS
jgi:hypothetical protein